MLNLDKEKALYPIIKHYAGVDIQSVYEEDGVYTFKTTMGETGEVYKSIEGDWDIRIENQVVESIEDIVFNILVTPEEKSEMAQFLVKAKNVLDDESVKYRSKVLITNIIKILEDFVLNSEFVPKKTMTIPPFWIFIYKGRKFINGLN
jgi:hypothetical protein